jgi:ribonuclease Y
VTGLAVALLVVLIVLVVVVGALLAVLVRRREPSVAPVAEPAHQRVALAAAAAQEQAAAAEALESARREAAQLTARAAEQAQAVRAQAEAHAVELGAEVGRLEGRKAELEADLSEQRADLARRAAEADRRDGRLLERETRLDAEHAELGRRDHLLGEREAAVKERESAQNAAEAERTAELERIALLTSAQARAELVAAIELQAKREAAVTVREIEREAREQGEERARRIVTLAVQRVATEQTAESTVSVLHLPDDSMKGRIIGREGRNIRTFESVTGVNVVIDDTPEAVLLSSFDPVRREVARVTLEALVADGRIQPSRIEEVYEKSRQDVDARCIRAGEDAWHELGLGDVHPDLIALLGRLRYRTSYGQNVLGHLVECAHLAGIMAAELRLPIEHAKRCAVLHDVGKALTHEVEGSPALIGAEVARRYGENEDVVHAIEAHHNEVEVRTLEAVLTQASDAMSGSRPGARRESLEHYVERLERLEAIAAAHAGVDRVFAMQAGREVRVAVLPDQVDDIGAQVLARDIAHEIETELTYPGQIRVTVVRESRATGLAR